MLNLFGTDSGTAVFSPCIQCPPEFRESCTDRRHRPWRYRLDRTWDPDLPKVCWIMLNPSTATAEDDDPTIRRCINFAKAWNYGGLVVTNLFALRATDPAELLTNENPVGPHNDHHITTAAQECAEVVGAWGSHRMVETRAAIVVRLLDDLAIPLMCLSTTKTCQPRHPLYLPRAAVPIPYPHG